MLVCGVAATALTVASSALHRRYDADTGLRRAFFANPRFEGTPVFVGRTTRLDLAFLDDEPDLPRRRFSARWQGTWHLPETGSVEFFLGGDDRLRLFLDGELVLERNAQLGRRTISATRMLDAGPHEVRLDYVQLGGGYRLNLQWAPAGEAARPFDPRALFPFPPEDELLARSEQLRLLRGLVAVIWFALPLAAGLVLVGPAAMRLLSAIPRARRRRLAGTAILVAVIVAAGHTYYTHHLFPNVLAVALAPPGFCSSRSRSGRTGAGVGRTGSEARSSSSRSIWRSASQAA